MLDSNTRTQIVRCFELKEGNQYRIPKSRDPGAVLRAWLSPKSRNWSTERRAETRQLQYRRSDEISVYTRLELDAGSSHTGA